MTSHARLARLLGQLTTLRVRSRRARDLKAEIEHLLMRTVTRRGLSAVERAVAAINTRDRHLVLTSKPQAGRTWREDFGTRTLEIGITAGRSYRGTSVRYQSSAKERLTPRQRPIQALQQSFYARYMSVGQKAYTKPRARLTPANRLILRIGKLEADVNNGGFDQYLDNKGRRRARAALSALHTVGAHKTARMLEKPSA